MGVTRPGRPLWRGGGTAAKRSGLSGRTLLIVALLLSAAACGDDAQGTSEAGGEKSPVATANYAPNILHLQGIGKVRFGEKRKDLLARKLIAPGEPGCGGETVYDVPGYVDAADLVFNTQDKLGFVWVLSPGVHTPENLTVDSPVAAVRKAYPQAEELKANERSFPGLLVKAEKTAYLFLYEPTTGQVVKLLAGYTDILREAQAEGITC
jgi:hypothetical protein